MNIPAVNSLNNRSIYKNRNNSNNSNNRQNFLISAGMDSVNFSGNPIKNTTIRAPRKMASATVAEFFGNSINITNRMLKTVAYRFLDTIDAVVSAMSQKGVNIVTMPRAMAEEHVLKSGTSAKSKVIRSGTMDLTDRIRTTVYVNDLYDLSTLYEFIKEMTMGYRGYKLADTEKPLQKMLAKGYDLTKSEKEKGIVKVEDISIRLCDDMIKNAKPETAYALDGRQKSGYEDIQLRFTKGKNKFETIMLFGPHYADAKHMESEKVRKYTRDFESLAIRRNSVTTSLTEEQNAAVDRMLGEIKYYINSIQGSFYDHVTRPLYHWAKGIDYYGMKELEKEKPNYTEINYVTFNRDFYNLKDKIKKCYDYIIDSIKDEKRKAEVEKYRTDDIRIVNNVRRGLEKTGTELGVLNIPPQKVATTK